MPCRDDSPVTVYVHGDDCQCSGCASKRKEEERQKKLRKDCYHKYMKTFEDGVLKAGLPVIAHIHQEEGRYDHYYATSSWSPAEATEQFRKWLDRCSRFPERMKFKFLKAFGRLLVVTWHGHKGGK